MAPVALRLIRIACAVTFVAGIAGMIITSVNGNNEGYVITIGMTTAVAALVLIAASATGAPSEIEVFDDVRAERLEGEVQALLADGADESQVRGLVRDAIRLGRR
jgi:hypothetical protein